MMYETNLDPRKGALIILSIILIFFILLLCSCTCEGRISRIKKRCPELLHKDTIKFSDTIVTRISEKDTVFNYLQKDTVLIKEGNMVIKYFYNTKDSTAYIHGKCDTIRIIKEYHVPYEKIVYKETFWAWFKQYWWILLIIVVAAIIYRFFKK